MSDWYPNRPKGAVEDKKVKKGRKRTKAGRKPVKGSQAAQKAPAESPAAPKLVGGYRAFIAKQMKEGKSMKDAAKAWREQKDAA